MKTPLVSIITPTYNHEQYIAKCIHSAQAQTYPHWEMIVVDDGSTDNTYAIAKSLAENDQRVKVFTQPNVGIFRLAETYNFALSLSVGKYIAVLEGDDVWLPEKLAWQVAAMESDEEIGLCWGKAYSSSQDLGFDYDLHPKNIYSEQILNNQPIGSALKQLTYSCFIPALTVLLRKSVLKDGFIQKYGLPLVDLPTWQSLSTQYKFHYIDKPLGKWRIYSGQVTKTHTARMAEGFYQLALELNREHPEKLQGLGITKRSIDKYFKELLVINYSRSGRYKLIRQDFKGARKDYLKSIFNFGMHELIWKLRSVVGLLYSLANKDIEGLTKKLGKVSYK